MRKKIVIANWKMNKNYADAKATMYALNAFLVAHPAHCEVVIAPPAVYIYKASKIYSSYRVKLAVQDIAAHPSGAYTGEISASMVASIGARYAILGHSERRTYFKESNALIKNKVDLALENGLNPVLCVGETLEQRASKSHFEVIESQLLQSLGHLSSEKITRAIIAYEPVWAIGTGQHASPEQAQEIHVFIRECLAEKWGEPIAQSIPIIYGGSVNASNAKELFSQEDIDGGLVGGASLVVDDFTKIIKQMPK